MLVGTFQTQLIIHSKDARVYRINLLVVDARSADDRYLVHLACWRMGVGWRSYLYAGRRSEESGLVEQREKIV